MSSHPHNPHSSKSTRSRLPSPSPARVSSTPNDTLTFRSDMTPAEHRTFLQRWLEPPVQNRPSFQEAGLLRGGVVENMAALGTMPKATAPKKTAGAEGSPAVPASTVKRIVLKKPYSPAPSTGAGVPDTTPPSASATATPPDMARSESAGMLDDAAEASLSPTSHLALPVPMVDDANDDDYVPVPKKGKGRRSHVHNASRTSASPASASVTVSSRRRQSHRHRSARSSPTPVRPSTPTLPPLPPPPFPVIDSTSAPTPVPTSPVPSETMSFQPAEPPHESTDKQSPDKIVEFAVEEALRHHRYPTAWALRLLYDERSGDPHFVSMLEDVFHQRASAKTARKFYQLISEKKKEGKEGNNSYQYFVPPPTGSRPTVPKALPAPYAKLIKMEFATLLRDAAGDGRNAANAETADVDTDGHGSKKRKTDGAEERTPSEGHISKKRKTDETEERTPLPDQAITRLNGTASTDGTGTSSHSHKHRHGGHHRKRHSRGGIAKNKSPRGKKPRTDSISSSSSLSSVPDEAIEDCDNLLDSVDGESDPEVSRMEDDYAEGNNAQIPAGSMQPISVKQAKPASKKQIVSPDAAPEQNTPTTHHPRSRDSSMPAVVITTSTTSATNGTPHHPSTLPGQKIKFTSRFGDFDDLPDGLAQKKLSRKSETAGITKTASEDSFVREPLKVNALLDEPESLPQPPAPPPERARLSRTPAPALSSRAARAAKRNHDEFEDASSPTVSFFRPDFELSSARNSRATTPINSRSIKKPRGGLRVKTSPMKKKGTSAGIPRGNGERPSPVANGVPHNQDDNDDSCYTCGGNGELVCCDGCTNSFHYTCIDPPIDLGHIPDEWYCNECQVRYNPPLVKEDKGIFASLVSSLQRKNASAFRLSEPIREYFEGVKTGAEGEYEETAPPKPKANKKNTEEAFDFYKIRSGDKAVLCHHCHKHSADDRPIIPCSVCGLHWHLECLNPPLALPPPLRTWRCPCHVNDLLGDVPARLAPAHKYRKIRNMPVIEQGFSRGLANNGWIEINEDDSDEEEAWKQRNAFGRVFRVSAKGIKHDFISRVHQNTRDSTVHHDRATEPVSTAIFTPQDAKEQEAALGLVLLGVSKGNGAQHSSHATIPEATPAAVSTMAQKLIANNGLANADVATLEDVLAQADALKQKVLKILEGRTNHACQEKSETELKALTPNSITHDDSAAVDEFKLDPVAPLQTDKALDADSAKSDFN
ncbi:hypothetical protein F4777DRAFT_547084 [Nemania sp. FL0916]|nr:hypothetical protein F4777DRAFT_547084 [Nemania sp. FL0916]